MLFNSLGFLIFFPVVCIIYFLLQGLKWRNLFLLVASYYFYMNWKPAYALLILTSTALTYSCGLLLEKYATNQRRKKTFLAISLGINFAILFLFKYFNFIGENITSLFKLLCIGWEIPTLDILLPVGISFYTFQAAGYSIDVYRGTIKAEHNFITYALFVSFFPQLVAGPIERAKNLLPQFHETHQFDYTNAVEGLKQMLWGFFMKLCVADVLAEYVNAVYNNVPQHNGTSLLIATFFFTFQIYCDFGGYSNIAIGAAKVMGFRLMENFHRPYLSLNIKEFWKRWHISLSSWFMDYVYIPLGGNKVTYPRHQLNLMTTFLISGVWHGANWTFILWGGIHGFYQIITNGFHKYVYKPKYDNWCSRLISTSLCFVAVSFAWIFFRANHLQDATAILGKMVCNQGTPFISPIPMICGLMSLSILVFKDIKDHFNWRIAFLHSDNFVTSFMSTLLLVSYIMLFGAFGGGQFIYFQF